MAALSSGYLVLPVVFHLVLVYVHCLEVNTRFGELLVSCPLNGDYKTVGFIVSGSKKGDNTDTSTVFGCNWPQGSQGKEACNSYESVSLVQLRERRVDLSVPTAFFSSNSTFTCDHSDSFPCAVFEPDEAHVTPSTQFPPPADKCFPIETLVFIVIIVTLLVMVFLIGALIYFRNAMKEAKSLMRKIRGVHRPKVSENTRTASWPSCIPQMAHWQMMDWDNGIKGTIDTPFGPFYIVMGKQPKPNISSAEGEEVNGGREQIVNDAPHVSLEMDHGPLVEKLHMTKSSAPEEHWTSETGFKSSQVKSSQEIFIPVKDNMENLFGHESHKNM